MKLMTRLLKNKFIMICLSLLLSLILIFSVVSKPVKAAIVLDDAIYFILATVTASLAINIAVDNPDTGAELARLWNDLSEGSKAAVKAAIPYVVKGSFTIYSWSASTYKSLCDEVASWFVNNHVNTTEYGQVIASNSSGKIGFTSDTSFRLFFDSNANTCTYMFSDSVIWIHNDIRFADLPGYSYKFNNLNNTGCAFVLKSNVGLEFVSGCIHYNNDYYARGKSFESLTGYWNEPEAIGFLCSTSFCSMTLSYTNNYDTNFCFYYDYINNICYHLGYTGSSYAFISDINANQLFQNLEFSSKVQAVDWFASTCGFATRSYLNIDGSYSAPRPAVDYDTTRTQSALDVINGKDTETIDTTFPGTMAQAQEISDNPAKVWDIEAEGTYTGNFALPDLESLSWYDKFPFCIPFDIVKLFTSFQAPAEAPHWHFQVIPENFFGLGNDAIYWDIDFAQYNVIVQILRFFLSVIFVFWLIMISRKVIGAE